VPLFLLKKMKKTLLFLLIISSFFAKAQVTLQWQALPNGIKYFYPGKSPSGYDSLYSFTFLKTIFAPKTGGSYAPNTRVGYLNLGSIVDLHYGVERGLGLASAATINTQTYDIASSSAKGATTITLTSNVSHEGAAPLVVDELIVYKGDDGIWYTAKIVSIVSSTLNLGAPLEAAVSAGVSKVSNYFINEAHPTQLGYIATADYIIKHVKNQERIDTRFQLNTVLNSGTVAIENSNTINNPGSSTVLANTIVSPTGITDGVQGSFTTSSTGAFKLRLIINTLGHNVKIRVTTNGLNTDTVINHNEPSLFEMPFVVSSNLSVMVTMAAVTNGDNFIVNQDVPVLKIIGLAPDLNSGVQVAFGDSWFAQHYLYQALVDRLPNANIINAGVGGNTSQQLIDRFSTDVAPYHPSVVYIVIGTNDYYQNVPDSVFSNNINKLKALCYSLGAYPIILISSAGSAQLTPSNFIRSREYANWIKYYDEAIYKDYVPYTNPLYDINAGAKKFISTGGFKLGTTGTGNSGLLTYNASLGVTQFGSAGSTNDYTLLTPAGGVIMAVPTGTQAVVIPSHITSTFGNITASAGFFSGAGTGLTGTAASLTSGLVTNIGNLTGDIISSNRVTTLATVNSNPGSWGTSTAVANFTVNAKGLITGAGTTAIQIAESQVTNLVTDLATFPTKTGTGASGSWAINTATTTALQTARNIQGIAFDGTANINPINGTGFVKATGTTLSYDNSTYITASGANFTGKVTNTTAFIAKEWASPDFTGATGNELEMFQTSTAGRIQSYNRTTLAFQTLQLYGSTIETISPMSIGGTLTVPDMKISTTPTTSGGTYDFLTRNTSTGVVEKVGSASIPTVTSTTASASGTGSATAFNFSYGTLGYTPSNIIYVPTSTAAAGSFYISSITGTGFTVTYLVAPVTGTSNITANVTIVK
jgi:hypothetical protein